MYTVKNNLYLKLAEVFFLLKIYKRKQVQNKYQTDRILLSSSYLFSETSIYQLIVLCFL